MIKGVDYIGVAVAFYCHDGRGNYLFHKRSENCRDEKGCWDCGGGSMNVGETIEEAVYREIKEELAVVPKEIELLGHSDVLREHDGEQTHWIVSRYRCLVDRDQVVNNEPEKHSDLDWFTMDNLSEPLHSEIPKELEWYKDKLV